MVDFFSISGLSVSYGGHRAIENISIKVSVGETVVMLGANGAGKTTTLRSICGMVKTAGQITFDGDDISGQKTENIVRHGVAHVPEGRGTFVRVTTEENLRLGAYTIRRSQEIADSMERVYSYFPRLKERRSQQAGTLSGGEQQMTAIGRALMANPKMMLLDEPSSFLDAPGKIELAVLLRDLAYKRNITVIAATHDLDISLRTSDRIWLINENHEVENGSPEDLIANNSIAKAFSGEKTKFNNSKRTFDPDAKSLNKAYVKGKGQSFELALSALERSGWQIVLSPNEAQIQVTIISNGQLKVMADNFETTGDNFAELSSAARKLKDHAL